MTGFQLAAMTLAVIGNVAYHLSQKSVPKDANPLIVLFHAYLVASGLCLVMVLGSMGSAGFTQLFRARSISLLLGVGVLTIEVGILLMYRSGWPVGKSALINTLLVTMILLPVGMWFFGETIPPIKLAGLVVCLIGTIMLCWQ